MAIIVLFACTQTFMSAGNDQRGVEHRTEVINHAQRGLDILIRDVRQAEWVYFSSSQMVDMATHVRVAGGATVERHVRHDCRGDACIRREGPAVAYPPGASPTFDESTEVIGSSDRDALHGYLTGHDIFRPQRVDPTTGLDTPDYLDPNLLLIRVRLRIDGLDKPIELSDGVSLRNTTRFEG